MPKKKTSSTAKTKLHPKSRTGDKLLVSKFEIYDEIPTPYPHLELEMAQATLLIYQKKLAEAEAQLTHLLQIAPLAQQLYVNLGAVYMQTGREAEAEAILEQAIQKFPRYALARVNLARIALLKYHDTKRAWNLLMPGGRLLRRFYRTEFVEYLFSLSNLMAYKDQYDAALAWLEMLGTVMPETPGLGRKRFRLRVLAFFHQLIFGKKLVDSGKFESVQMDVDDR